jgi:hypothetical protein
VEGEIKAIHETKHGRKIQVAYGDRTGLVDEKQIVAVVKEGK